MSMAASLPCIKLTTTTASSTSSCSSSSSTTMIRLSSVSHSKPCLSFTTIRSSQTEGPIRRPVAPPIRSPSPSPSPSPLQPQTPPLQQTPSQARAPDVPGITMEFQRAKARELQEYFKQKKLQEADQGPAFGFVPKNEINNGRWAMFGFAVGMLTEYATGSDFVDQVKLILSNLGIVDLE